MEEKKVSVIIPVRNESVKSNAELLRSIFNQTSPLNEIIFVIAKDSETDILFHEESQKIYNNLKEQVLETIKLKQTERYVYNKDSQEITELNDLIVCSSFLNSEYIVLIKEAQGIADARQYGSENATGDILAYTDADTVLDKNWIKEIKKSLEQTDFVYGKNRFIENTIPSYLFELIGYKIFPYTISKLGLHPIVGSNMAIRKSFFDKNLGGFNTDLMFGEDNDLGQRCKPNIMFNPDMKVYTSNRRVNTWYKMLHNSYLCVRYVLGLHINKYKNINDN